MQSEAGKGANVTGRLTSDNAKDMIRQLYNVTGPKGKVLDDTGDRLINALNTEGMTTRNASAMIHGSRTTPMKADMDKLMENAGIAGDILTANAPRLWSRLGTRIATGGGERLGRSMSNMITETNPAKNLSMLNRMSSVSRDMKAQQQSSGIKSGIATAVGSPGIQPFLQGSVLDPTRPQ